MPELIGGAMAERGKKYKNVVESLGTVDVMPINEAFSKLKELKYAKFDESVDVDVNLGIDASKGDQVVRGSALLPNGRGRKVRVLVFAKGEHAEAAKQAGADYVGVEDLIEKISGGWMDFDFSVATPDVMGSVGKLARILGARGLLPNKKLGTVTFDVADVVADLKKGRAFFKNDKNGLVHFSIGRVSFEADQLSENLVSFIRSLVAARPATVKGQFIKRVHVTSTMGAGIQVSLDEVMKRV